MAYSKFERQTWNDERVRLWTRDTRELWHYLLTSPHMDRGGSRIGCYVLDPMYAAADLSTIDHAWTPQMVEAEIRRLAQIGRVMYDPTVRLVLILNHFRHNHPENPNVARAAANDVGGIPFSRNLFERLRERCLKLCRMTTDKNQPFCQTIVDAIDARLRAEAEHRSDNTLPDNYLEPSPNLGATLGKGSGNVTPNVRQPGAGALPEPIPEPEHRIYPPSGVTETSQQQQPASPVRTAPTPAGTREENGERAAATAEPMPADREDQISLVIRAANRGMIENRHLPDTTPPILTTHGKSRQQADDWIEAGIPLDTLVAVVHHRAKEYVPDGPRDRIRSLAYFDAAVREAHETGLSSAWEPPEGSDAHAVMKRGRSSLEEDRPDTSSPRTHRLTRIDGYDPEAERRRQETEDNERLAQWEADHPDDATWLMTEAEAEIAEQEQWKGKPAEIVRVAALGLYRRKLRVAMEQEGAGKP